MRQFSKYLTVTAAGVAFALLSGLAVGPTPVAASPGTASPIRSTAAGAPDAGVGEAGAAEPGAADAGRPWWGWDQLRSSVRVTRTGGFIGVREEVVIRRDGQWTYSNWRFGGVQHGRLTWWQIRTLNRLLANPALYGRPPRPSQCPDAFMYRLVAGRANASYTDCNNPRGPWVAVVEFVIRVTPL